jgi:phage tail-like protein
MQDRHGPLRTGRFVVEIDGIQVDGFRVVDLPGRSTKMEESQGPERQRNLWGQTEYEDLEMERGATRGDTTLFDWREAVDQGKLDEGRKDLAVVLQDDTGGTAMRWEFTKAWPRRYDPPTLDVTADSGDDDIAIEKVTIVFDEMKRTK